MAHKRAHVKTRAGARAKFPVPAPSRKVTKNEKLIAAKTLIESVPASKALSHSEKRAATRILAGTPDGELPALAHGEAARVAERPHVRDAIVEALGKVGVNVDSLAKVIAEGLRAEETKFFAHEGLVVDERQVVDHSIRHRFLETTLRVVGAGPKEAGSAPPSANVFVFRSFLGGTPVDTQVGAPDNEIVKRRLKASKANNRSYA